MIYWETFPLHSNCTSCFATKHRTLSFNHRKQCNGQSDCGLIILGVPCCNMDIFVLKKIRQFGYFFFWTESDQHIFIALAGHLFSILVAYVLFMVFSLNQFLGVYRKRL